MFRKRSTDDRELRIDRRRVRGEPYQVILEHLQGRLLSVDAAETPSSLSRLSSGQSLLYALGTLDHSVQSSGWQGYFWDADGNLFPEALRGATALQVPEWEALLNDASRCVPGGYVVDIDQRQAALSALSDSEIAQVFGPLDARLYELDAAEKTSMKRLLMQYVDAHPEEFFLPA